MNHNEHLEKEHLQDKQKTSLSIKKARGTIDKVFKMTEEGAYCPEIIQQIDAAKGLLDSAKKSLLRGHLNHCLEKNMKENKNEAIKELIKIFDLK